MEKETIEVISLFEGEKTLEEALVELLILKLNNK